MATNSRTVHIQLTLDVARRPQGRGGWRPGAGRPRGRNVAHVSREEFASTIPQHVTLSLVPGVPSLRDDRLVKLIRGQIAQGQRPDCRITQFTVQDTHLHMVNEAADRQSLATGIQALKVRIAKRLNKALGRTGSLFEDRYHARALRTPREVRNALRYVLNNARHHAFERGEVLDATWIDPCSSAAWFDGWAAPLDVIAPTQEALFALPSPVQPPRTWLLRIGWRKHGLIHFDELPGPHRTAKRPGRRS